MTAPIAVTAAAAAVLADQLARLGKPEACVRIVAGANCADGGAPGLEVATAPQPGDEVVEAQGVTVAVETRGLMFVAGLVLDAVDVAGRPALTFVRPEGA